MAEADLQQQLDKWTGERTPDYGALCTDLAQMKLQKVCFCHISNHTSHCLREALEFD